MATPLNPQFIPSTIDTVVLNTTLADYARRLTDNAYNSNIVLLSGEAGVGKSHLLQAITSSVAEDADAWLNIHYCSPYEKNTALFPIRDIIENVVLKFNPEESQSDKIKKIDSISLLVNKNLLSKTQKIISEAKIMADAARLNADRGAAIIDINMGCPVKKVVNGDAGSALMRDLPLAASLPLTTRSYDSARTLPGSVLINSTSSSITEQKG